MRSKLFAFSLFIIFFLIGLTLGQFTFQANSPEQTAKQLQYDTFQTIETFAAAQLEMEKLFAMNPDTTEYQDWVEQSEKTIALLESVEQESTELQASANYFETLQTAHRLAHTPLIPQALAKYDATKYTPQKISAIFDAAPSGKKIAALAEHLEVDAKQAYAILKTTQAQMTADAWNTAGDTFENLENGARVVKDAAKVGLYVGGAMMTGGSSSTVATIIGEANAIIGGADLVLEIGEDASNIVYGYNSKATALFTGMRSLSNPAASIVGFAGITTATSAYDRFSSVMFGVDQINSAIQENTYLGINVDFDKLAMSADGIKNDQDLQDWMKHHNIPEDIETQKPKVSPSTKPTKTSTSPTASTLTTQPAEPACDITGSWSYQYYVYKGSPKDPDSDITLIFDGDTVTQDFSINGVRKKWEYPYYFKGCAGAYLVGDDSSEFVLEIQKDGTLHAYQGDSGNYWVLTKNE